MEFKCKITRSCIYWDPEKRETMELTVEADTFDEAKRQLRKKALRIDMSSGSKLIQDVLIKINGVWKNAL